MLRRSICETRLHSNWFVRSRGFKRSNGFNVQRLTRPFCSTNSEETQAVGPVSPLSELAGISHAPTVVIGGGIAGCSVLYHLGKAGVTDCVLLEKSELTAGSTWHAAGLVAGFHPGVNMRFLHHYSIDLYKKLEAETGMPVGFHTPDSIRLIETGQRMDEAHYQMGKSALYNYHQEFITPEKIAELHPLLNLDGIAGGIHNRSDGHIDPSSVTNALSVGARMRGGRVFTHTAVCALERTESGKWKVGMRTADGKEHSILADNIVNCAGLWCAKVGEMAGVRVPVYHIEHQYVITERIPGVAAFQEEHGKQLPVVRDLVGSYYVRQERDGLLYGPYESDRTMQTVDRWAGRDAPSPPDEFGMELFPEDLERLQPHLEHAMERLPCVQEAGIRSVVNGPVAWPPDGNPLVGPSRGKNLKGYWSCCGLSYGIAQGGGLGSYLVHWMTNGEPPYELLECDPERYGQWTTRNFTREKVRETYGFNNSITCPHEERPAGRPVRTSPLYRKLLEKRGVFGFNNGWEVPLYFNLDGSAVPTRVTETFRRPPYFSQVERECHAVRRACGVIDLTAFSKYEIRGESAGKFLNRMCAGRIPKVGRCSITHMLTPTGKVLAELTLTRLAKDHFYVITGGGVERHDLRWLEDHLEDDSDVTITNVTSRFCVLGLAGANSRRVLERMASHQLDLSESGFRFLDSRVVELGGAPGVNLTRISFTGLLGYEMHVAPEYAESLYTSIREAGKDLGLVDFGSYAMNSLRMEAGFKICGMDMTKDHTALDAGLDKFLKISKKTPFIGKDALIQQESDGVKRRAVYLVLDPERTKSDESSLPFDHALLAEPAGNEPIYARADTDPASTPPVGFTTSGAFGHCSGRTLAFGHLDAPLNEIGTRVYVRILGVMREAEVREQGLAEGDFAEFDGKSSKIEHSSDRKATNGETELEM
eukprot:212038_1